MAKKAAPSEATKRRGRPPAQVDPNTPGGRLQALRLQHDMSQDGLAKVLQVDRSMISKYEDGRHPMGPEHLERASKRFDVTPSFILFGDEVVFAERTSPLLGDVGAGAPIEAIQAANPDLIGVPSGFEDAIAFRVKGASCEPVFEDDDIVLVRKGQPGEGAFVGRFCVVETVEGNGYLKQVVEARPAPGGQGRAYTLRSPNADDLPIQNIKSARPVILRIIKGGR